MNDKKRRGKGFKGSEIDRLLDFVEKYKPCGMQGWENLAHNFNRNLLVGFEPRDADTLRRKFKNMVNVKKPTGDPDIPKDIKRAKYIQKVIDNYIGVQILDDDIDESENSRSILIKSPLINSENQFNQETDFDFDQNDSNVTLDDILIIESNEKNVSKESDIVLTPRLGKTIDELHLLKRRTSSSSSKISNISGLSETARKRIKIEENLSDIKKLLEDEPQQKTNSSTMDILSIMMERDVQWRKENEELRKQERFEREERERKERQEREERDRKAEERFFLLISALKERKN